jgi:hypothetical protein
MDVALIGLILPQVQNHSLGRLAAAVRLAGFGAEILPFGGFGDIEAVIGAVMRDRPRICGVSMQTAESALASATLVEMLRLHGYQGQIVVGGHFATLNAEDLLREVTSIDLVVRFAGEPALVALLRERPERRLDPTALEEVPGVVFRDLAGGVRRGAPPVLGAVLTGSGVSDPTDPQSPMPVHLGFPAADMVGSRGCEAHCSYCCVAGVSDAAEAAGGSRYTRQATNELADEMARLYHRHDVRAFNFMDDNLLPMEPDAAHDWCRALSMALHARAVDRIAFSLQMRADVCTDEVVSALVHLGLVRAYVGIDGYSGRQLVALGRNASHHAGPLALARLAGAGVFSVCNALILGPTFLFASLEKEIDALGDVRHAPVHLLPLDVRKGSSYFNRVHARGLLEGGMLLRRYRFEDPRTALLADAVTAFPTRLEEYSVPIALYDLGYNLGIARRLVPGADIARATETYRDVTRRWNTDQVRVLKGAAAVARTLNRQAVADFIAAEREGVGALDNELRAACARALHDIETAVSQARGTAVHAHRRGSLLSGVALSMMLSACDHGRAVSANFDAAAGVDLAPSADTGRSSLDALVLVRDQASATPTALDALSLVCGDGGRTPTEDPSLVVPFDCCFISREPIQVTFDDAGVPVALTLVDGGVAPDGLVECVLRWLGNYCYPSAAGTTQPLMKAHCWIA